MNLRKTPRVTVSLLFIAIALMIVQVSAFGQTTVTTSSSAASVPIVPNPCPRFAPGSVVHNPPALFSSNGALSVQFSYQHRFDTDGTEGDLRMTVRANV